MPNLFGVLNIPAQNGPGAAFNVASFGYSKSLIVQPGDTNDRTTVEFSTDGVNWSGANQGALMSPTLGTPPSFFPFNPLRPDKRPQAFMSFDAAVQFARVQRFSPLLGGPAPIVGIAGDDVTTNIFAALNVPSENGTGTVLTPSAAHGPQWTFQLGGALTRGNVVVEASIDGILFVPVATFNQQQPRMQIVDGAFFQLRVRKTQTLASEVQTVTYGNAGGEAAAGCCNLNQTYLAGTLAAHQTIPVAAANGGQVIWSPVAGTTLLEDKINPFAAGTVVTANRHFTPGVNANQRHFTDVWIEDLNGVPRNRQRFEIGRTQSQDEYNTQTANFYSAGVGANIRVESFRTVETPDWMWIIVEDGDIAVTAGKQKLFSEKRIAGNASSCWSFAYGNQVDAANTLALVGNAGFRGVVFKVVSTGNNIKHIRFDDILRGNFLAGTALTVPIVKLIFEGAVTVEHNAAAPPAGTRAIKLAGSVNLVAKADDVLTLVMDNSHWQEDGRKIS